MKLQLKARLEKYTEQIFMTDMAGLYLYLDQECRYSIYLFNIPYFVVLFGN